MSVPNAVKLLNDSIIRYRGEPVGTSAACDFYGQPLALNRADSSFMNHRGVLYVSDKALAEAIRGLWPIDES